MEKKSTILYTGGGGGYMGDKNKIRSDAFVMVERGEGKRRT